MSRTTRHLQRIWLTFVWVRLWLDLVHKVLYSCTTKE